MVESICPWPHIEKKGEAGETIVLEWMSFENRRKDFLLIFYNSIKTYKYIRGFQNEKLNTRNGKLKAGYEFQGLRDLFANPFFPKWHLQK